MAEATGPRWSNASQKLTPGDVPLPGSVSAIHPPASASAAEMASTWLARWPSRTAISFREPSGPPGGQGPVRTPPGERPRPRSGAAARRSRRRAPRCSSSPSELPENEAAWAGARPLPTPNGKTPISMWPSVETMFQRTV